MGGGSSPRLHKNIKAIQILPWSVAYSLKGQHVGLLYSPGTLKRVSGE